jgi:tRNA(Ile)-lysidine synthase
MQVNSKQKVEKALVACDVEKGARILVGFSGGPDSTALLHSLKSLDDTWGFKLFAAYCDHGIRPEREIEKEIAHIRKATAGLQIELFIGRIPGGELKRLASIESRSVEDIAREKRYLFLHSVSEKIHAAYIAVGHTRDDHLETMIMRFFQGSDITGLKGIVVRRGMVIRPLFYWSKVDVMKYVTAGNIRFMVDSTNLKSTYLRNKIRLNLIPVIQNIFPGFRSSLLRFADKMNLLNDYITNELNEKLKWEKVPSGFRIKGVEFLGAHGIIRLFSLYRIVNMLGETGKVVKKGRIPHQFLSAVLNENLLRQKTIILRGYGFIFLWKGEYLFCISDIVYPQKKGYLMCGEKNIKLTIPGSNYNIVLFQEHNERDHKNNVNTVYLNDDRIDYPLVIRSRMPGDRLGMEKGSKSLKKLFNEWKIPEKKRWLIPVLEDKKGIIGVLGKAFGVYDRFIPEMTAEGETDICRLGITIMKQPDEEILPGVRKE